MYNYYNPNQTQTQQTAYRPQVQQVIGLKGRPVASIEEARAATIDFNGSIFFFPDLANKKIYTKQINMDGTMSLNMYEMKEVPTEEPNLFITREEFEKAMAQFQNQLSSLEQHKSVAPRATTDFEVKF